jgi:hypothetical protein
MSITHLLRNERFSARRRKCLAFKDIEHLIRLALVMAFAAVAFIFVRAAVIPRSFGQYGHYRADAMAEIAARKLLLRDTRSARGCHTEVVDQKKLGKHTVVPCEACHGALSNHAEDPASVTPPKLGADGKCRRRFHPNDRLSQPVETFSAWRWFGEIMCKGKFGHVLQASGRERDLAHQNEARGENNEMWLRALDAGFGVNSSVADEHMLAVASVRCQVKRMTKSHRIPLLKWVLRYGWHLTH